MDNPNRLTDALLSELYEVAFSLDLDRQNKEVIDDEEGPVLWVKRNGEWVHV
jgi:hypothetical protein